MIFPSRRASRIGTETGNILPGGNAWGSPQACVLHDDGPGYRRRVIRRACLLSGFALLLGHLTCGGVAAEETAAEPRITILLLGDSTVATYPHPPEDAEGITGWGQVLGDFFQDRVTVINRAAGGRSSKSFIQEGRLHSALQEHADYVFIQFGHNDCPGKGGRTTDPAGDYRDYLRQYIQQCREAGAKPILVTPVARRTFQGDQLQDILRPYAEAMIEVGRETMVPVIDLHQASTQLYRQLGDAGSASMTVSPTDKTHFTRAGAVVIARLIVDRIPQLVPELAATLKPAP